MLLPPVFLWVMIILGSVCLRFVRMDGYLFTPHPVTGD